MPGQIVDLRKNHRPWNVGRSTHQLAVDEIAKPPGRKTQRAKRCDEIGHVEPALSTPRCEEPQGDQHAEKATVEAHATVPQLEDFERVSQVVERLVEQHVAEPAAED